jgi:GntR family transcriptional regulator/MocR family aminotransferase
MNLQKSICFTGGYVWPGRGAAMARGGVLVTGKGIGGLLLPHEEEEAAGSADEVVDASGMLVMPPLVNGHVHSTSTLLRGTENSLPLELWSYYAIGYGHGFSEEAVRYATLTTDIEMIRNGIGGYIDHFPQTRFVNAALSAHTQSGLRIGLAPSFVDAIDGKKIPEGVRLPSSRSIAETLDIGRNTVIAATNSLIEQGYLVAKDRSGIFVAVRNDFEHGGPRQIHRDGSYDWSSRLRLSRPASEKPAERAQPGSVTHNLMYGQFDPSTFPISHWRQCERSALGVTEIAEWGRDAFDRDDDALLTSLCQHVLPKHGIWAEQDELLITLGGQEGRYLVAQLLCKAAVRVGLENPGLADMTEIVATTPAVPIALNVGEAGVELSDKLSSCNVLFTMPGHHCPTTAVMPADRRLELLDRARRTDMIIVEDTYETELLAHTKTIPSLKSLDREGRVIHIGSLSKSVAPGLRVGFVVASPVVIRKLREIRRLIHRHPPGNIQRALAMFIERGYYHSYIRHVSTTILRRTDTMKQSLARWIPEVRVRHCEGASSFWIELPAHINAGELSSTVAKRGVLIESGKRFYSEGARHNCLRIAVSQIPDSKIVAAVKLIHAAMNHHALPKALRSA